MSKLDSRQDSLDKFRIQDDRYHFPYHYIPHLDDNGVGTRVRALSWGLAYLCYLKHIQELVYSLRPSSVLDVGCGDGRLIGMLGPRIKLRVGVDLSERAIRFARAFHHDVKFRAVDAQQLDETFDVVTAIEVLEHIPDAQTCQFLKILEERTNNGGYVIVSVPTTVVPLNKKHYRHYDLNLFRKQLEESDANLKITNVDYVYKSNTIVEFYTRLTQTRWWVIELKPLNSLMWNYIWSKLRKADEKHGRHLVVLLRKTGSEGLVCD